MSDTEESAIIQSRIQRAKDQLQTMIDLNPDCMMMLDADGAVVRANRALVNLLAHDSFASVLGTPVHQLFGHESIDVFDAVLKDVDGIYGFCRLDATLDGSLRNLEFTRVGGDEESQSAFIVVEDITDKLIEDLATEQEHKITAVKQMMGAMMHHLNQPLTVIMLRANMLTSAVSKEKYTSEQVLDAMHEISEMSMKLAGLLSKLESSETYEVENYTSGLEIMKIDAP